MKILLSTYIYVLMLSVLGFMSIEFLIMNRQTNLARSFHEVCVENIENSYFDLGILDKCRLEAKDLGYEITIEDCSLQLEDEKIPRYFITLKYKVEMPIFGIGEESTIKGYAG